MKLIYKHIGKVILSTLGIGIVVLSLTSCERELLCNGQPVQCRASGSVLMRVRHFEKRDSFPFEKNFGLFFVLGKDRFLANGVENSGLEAGSDAFCVDITKTGGATGIYEMELTSSQDCECHLVLQEFMQNLIDSTVAMEKAAFANKIEPIEEVLDSINPILDSVYKLDPGNVEEHEIADTYNFLLEQKAALSIDRAAVLPRVVILDYPNTSLRITSSRD